ncbi:hypothetical protein F2P81_002255 [Scophthalmus maximus]|uniref:Uncharacterized protein n=1 Tax=Scophthalmus maximus TaxID=52904 RepID=A0A6A4TDR0_SCOMX|nr:hypothetical protein F2P81_002255 [Scophthalmus maximus]
MGKGGTLPNLMPYGIGAVPPFLLNPLISFERQREEKERDKRFDDDRNKLHQSPGESRGCRINTWTNLQSGQSSLKMQHCPAVVTKGYCHPATSKPFLHDSGKKRIQGK